MVELPIVNFGLESQKSELLNLAENFSLKYRSNFHHLSTDFSADSALSLLRIVS